MRNSKKDSVESFLLAAWNDLQMSDLSVILFWSIVTRFQRDTCVNDQVTVSSPHHESLCAHSLDANLRSLYCNIAHDYFLSIAFALPLDTNLMGLYRVVAHRLYASHHLFLGDQVVDSL